MKKWFNLIIYVSLVFLCYKLFKADYLKIPIVYNFTSLIISFVLLFLGMIANSMCWKEVLRSNNHQVSYSDGIVSIGLSIFTKYIPGKLLMILGRAEYISQTYAISRKITSSISLTTQLISVWLSLAIGILGIFFVGDFNSLPVSYYAIAFWFLISIVIFSPLLKLIFMKISSIFGKELNNIPNLSFISTLKVLPYFIINWSLWCVSFYFLSKALTENVNVSVLASFAFGLGASIGIISIFTPGGLGVREAIIGSFLVLIGLSVESSTTIAVTSRLWFLIGELFIFLYAFILNQKNMRPVIKL